MVTAADLAVERFLEPILSDILPGVAFVGEEGAHADAGVLDVLNRGETAWILDPVDGTQNFVDGKKCFAVIVALVSGGKTVAGWIYDPITDRMTVAEQGGGAWREGERLAVTAGGKIPSLRGFLGFKIRRRIEKKLEISGAPRARKLTSFRCAGMEYIALAEGATDFSFYRFLKPWDHAAGILIHGEAGGYSGLTDPARSPYRPRMITEATLLCAPNEATWTTLHGWLSGTLDNIQNGL